MQLKCVTSSKASERSFSGNSHHSDFGKISGKCFNFTFKKILYVWRLLSIFREFRDRQNFIIYGRDNSIDKEAAVPRCPSKLMFLKIFAIFTGKHLCWSLFLIRFRSVHTGKVGSRTLWSDPGPGTLMQDRKVGPQVPPQGLTLGFHLRVPGPGSHFSGMPKPATLLKRDSTQVFSCEYCEISKNSFIEHLLWLLLQIGDQPMLIHP